MRLRFASQLLNGWDDPSHRWLREVRRRARFVWVRLAGLNEVQFVSTPPRDHDGDAPHLVRWEEAASCLCTERITCAYLVVYFHRLSPKWPGGEPIGTFTDARRRWGRTMVVAERLEVLLRTIRVSQPHPVGVFAEDFSARWLAASGFIPYQTVLDNPMISASEADGAFAPLFNAPGYIRASRWPALGGFDTWGMHFDMGELVAFSAGVPSRCRHARWNSLTEAETAAGRARGPLRPPSASPP